MPTTCTKVAVTGEFTGTTASGAPLTTTPWSYDSSQSKCHAGTNTGEYFKVFCDPEDCAKTVVKEYDDAACNSTNEKTSSSMEIKDITKIQCGGSDEGCVFGKGCSKQRFSGVRGLRGIVIVGLMTVFIATMSM